MPKNKLRMPGVAVLVAVLAFSACSAGPSGEVEAAGDARPVVLTTFTVLADMAKQVAGDELRVESITKVGAEIHGYEPTPGDIRRAQDADLILDNGLNLESWFAQFVERLDVPHVVVSEGVEELSITEDAYEGLPNPHAWMSPLNAQIYVTNMAKAFSDLDPGHAADYAANAATYSQEIQLVQDELVTRLESLPETQRALVTCEGAFSYLTRDVGLQEAYIWAVNAEQQATPQKIADTIDFVSRNKVPAVFCESTVSADAMKQVAREAGAAFAGVLYVDSLSEPAGPVPSYLELLRYDADTIIAGLTGAAG